MAIRSATPGGSTGSSPFPAATPAASNPTAALVPVRLQNGQMIYVSSQADAQALAASIPPTPVLDLSRQGASSTTGDASMPNLINIAADGFNAVSGFLAGRTYNRLIQDYQNAQNNLTIATNTLEDQLVTNPAVIQPMLNALDALNSSLTTGINLLNAQITAVDMMAGGSAAKVVGQFLNGSNTNTGIAGGGGIGTGLALGAAGLGLGLVMSNNNNNQTVAPVVRRRS